ncbi:MAG: hypothetical protein P1V81_16195 [Planctomycetota bacterium]|nr:hypothetical protein [Planctomycetota bacterium]
MPRWLRTLLLVAAIAWIAATYAPYFGSEGGSGGAFLGGDLALLTDAAGGAQLDRGQAEPVPLQEMAPATYANAGGPRGSVLTGASLALSRRLWGVAPSSAALYRIENLLLLLVAGLGLANFVRRLLLPWTGTDHARAAARALPAVLFLHPLSVQCVVDLGGRAELLYLALGSWAAATYLRARQDRRLTHVLGAGLLALLAGLAGRSGLGLALVIAIAEFTSVQRYQARGVRLRRGLTCLALFLAVSASDSILRLAFGAGDWAGSSPIGSGSPLERLGVLVVPVPLVPGDPSAWTGLFVALAVALFLTSMHPALRAARWAPRLWGWLLGGWFAVLFVAVLGGEVVSPSNFTHAETLFPATAILVSGMVVVATGVQGFRRLILPVVLALGFGAMSLAQVSHHARSTAITVELRKDLGFAVAGAEQARTRLAERGFASLEGPAILVVVDEPEREAWRELALDPFEGGIGHLLDGSLTGVTSLRLDQALRRPALIDEQALLVLARTEAFDALRAGGVVLLLRNPEGSRSALSLQPPSQAQVPPAWRGDAGSPDLDLDPMRFEALVVNLPVVPLPSTSSPAGEVRFLPRAGGPDRTAKGLWLASSGPRAGIFDLSSELDWLLAGRVARMWFPTGLARVESCELLAELPGAPVTFDTDGDDWVAPLPSFDRTGLPAEVTWSLELLGLETYTFEHFDAAGGEAGRLRFEDVAARLEDWPSEEVVWSLELRAGDRRIWRHHGRVQ